MMGGRALVVAGLASAALALLAAEAAPASDSLPRLLTKDFTAKFAVRPAQIIFTGHGGPEVVGGKAPSSASGAARFGRIDWTSWTSTQATATVVLWFDHEVGQPPNKYFPRNGHVVASVVRGGRFTRLAITVVGALGREVPVLTRADASGRPGLRYTWG
jgi:hypothetical protein